MEIFNQEFTEEFIRLTWRNPAFMAIAIALVLLIPQLFIRKIIAKKEGIFSYNKNSLKQINNFFN